MINEHVKERISELDIDGIPEGWILTTIAEIADLNPPKPSQNALPPHTPVTFVPMPAVDAESGVISKPETRLFSQVRKGYTAFREGDVIMAKITPCMENGKAAVVQCLENALGFGSTEFHVLRSNGSVLPEYLYHFIRLESFRKAAESQMTGSVGQKRVPVEFLKQAEIPLPPIVEQKRIVAKVQELLARANDTKGHLVKVSMVLKRLRQAVLAAACSGRLTEDWRKSNSSSTNYADEELPLDWRRVSVGEVIENLKYGTSQKCSYEKHDVPVLRIPNIERGVVDHKDLKYAELRDKEFQQLRLLPGDILLIRSNGSVSLVGRSALVRDIDRDFAYAGYLIRLRPDFAKIIPDFLNLVLGSHDVRVQIEVPARSTSGVHNINGEEVRALQFFLPPVGEQREIVNRVDSMFKLADTIEKRVELAEMKVEMLTQAILTRAFRGELVPTEAELARRERRSYETASELLSQIKSHRESEKTKHSKKK